MRYPGFRGYRLLKTILWYWNINFGIWNISRIFFCVDMGYCNPTHPTHIHSKQNSHGVSKLHLSQFVEQKGRLMTKPTKWYVRPAKTQISPYICPVWSEFSLSAWRKLGSLATHWAHSEDSDWADAQTDLSPLWAHTPFCWFCHEAAQTWTCSFLWRVDIILSSTCLWWCRGINGMANWKESDSLMLVEEEYLGIKPIYSKTNVIIMMASHYLHSAAR